MADEKKTRRPFFCASRPNLGFIILWFLAKLGCPKDEIVLIRVPTAYPTKEELKALRDKFKIAHNAQAFYAGVSEFAKGANLDDAMSALRGQVRSFSFKHLPLHEKKACEWLLEWVLEQSETGSGKQIREVQHWVRQAFDIPVLRTDETDAEYEKKVEKFELGIINEAYAVVNAVYEAKARKYATKADLVDTPEEAQPFNLAQILGDISSKSLYADELKDEYKFTTHEDYPFSVGLALDCMANDPTITPERMLYVAQFWAWIRHSTEYLFNKAVEESAPWLQKVEYEKVECFPDGRDYRVAKVFVTVKGNEGRWIFRGVSHELFEMKDMKQVHLLVARIGQSIVILPNKTFSKKVRNFAGVELADTLNRIEAEAGGQTIWYCHEATGWVIAGSVMHPEGPFTVLDWEKVTSNVCAHLAAHSYGKKVALAATAK